MQILFFKLNHFSKSFIKIILHNHLFNFEDTFQNPQFFFFFQKKKESNTPTFFFSALYMFQNVLIVHFLFQLCTCSGMCLLYTLQNPQFFFLSFKKKKKESNAPTYFLSALYTFQNVLILHFLFQLCTCSRMCLLYSYIIHMSCNSI